MSYSYDSASQLSGISYTNGSSLTYGYDLAGRRTSMGGSLAQTALPLPVNEAEYNQNNQLTEWGTASLGYDLNGNMTSDGVNSYSWNARNQLASMNFGSNAFTYDAYGRRVGKTISSTTTNYLYDGANTVQELSGGSVTANLLAGLGIDERFTRTDSNGTANFLTDALGTTLELTNSSGSSLAQYSYEPFGNTFFTSGSSANTYEYTGRENDGSGVYFYRGRYYSSTLQRFISEDPIGSLGSGPNLYAYVGNNPISFRDPTGNGAIGAVVGGVVGAVTGAMGAGLQGGSTGQVIWSGVIGGAAGALLGALDPTEGALTVGQIAALSGMVGLAGDVTGQLVAGNGSLNLGEAIGAGLGSAAAGWMGAVTAVNAAAMGASELAQALMAGGISAAPATLGGPAGAALGPSVPLGPGSTSQPATPAQPTSGHAALGPSAPLGPGSTSQPTAPAQPTSGRYSQQ